MLSIFKPAPHRARLPEAEIDPLYRRLRWQIFLGIFFGYAAYYLVRKNFALAMPYLVEQGFSRGDLGFALSGISIAYGFSKFIMGSVSDRSNPRVFLPAGLILAAAVMLFMGFVQAFYMVFLWQRETPRDSPFDRPEAPPGFAWVLMTEQEAAARHAANRGEVIQEPRPSWMDDA